MKFYLFDFLLLAAIGYSASVDCSNMLSLAIGLRVHIKQPAIWITLQNDYCTAVGVTCVNSRVTMISWSNLGLDGVLNGTNLDLYSNQLTGEIYSPLSSRLEVLYLDDNNFTSVLPEALPDHMTIFSVDYNNLTS